MDDFDYNSFVNILTSLKSKSDLKWILKTFSTGPLPLNSQGTHLSNYEKKKILEQNIKLSIQTVRITYYNNSFFISRYYNFFLVTKMLFDTYKLGTKIYNFLKTVLFYINIYFVFIG